MKRGKPLIDTRQYCVINPTGQRERGNFTREEAIAQAKRKEQELKEWGYPRTKHRVVYAPTGEDIHFEGVKDKTMAKRRKRRVNFGASKTQHLSNLERVLNEGRQKVSYGSNAVKRGECRNA